MMNVQDNCRDEEQVCPGTPCTGANDDDLATNFPGPLMHCSMQKVELIRYIQHNARRCLQSKTPGDKDEYFYWQIMDLFLCHNGEVTMTQVARILYDSYNLLRMKRLTVKDSEKMKAWCLPLEQLLCSSAPYDERKEAVIKMGDDLAERGCTYAAHICYVVAKVDLGTRNQFDLIGCNNATFPFGLCAMTSAVERTEVYEYVLSLTSGRAQPHFQMIKLCHANRLALLDFSDKALEYCEIMAKAVMTFPCSIKISLFTRLIRLSEHVQDGQTELAWLLELHRLQNKVATIKANPENHLPSTNSTVENYLMSFSLMHRCPVYRYPCLQCYAVDPEAMFDSRYTMGKLLRKKAFECVYAGIRKEDKKEVTIKLVRKHPHLQSMVIPGTTHETPLEVVLIQMVSKPPCCNIVQLLECFEMSDRIIMVLEKPSPCLDLSDFVTSQGGRLTEEQARDIMLQVIRAAHHCIELGVLHCDINSENLIISTDTMQVKLTNFGSATLLMYAPHKEYTGSLELSPPELEMGGICMDIPSTVWGLGVLLFRLVCGDLPFQSMTRIEKNHLKLCPGVSQDFFNLLMWCLDLEPHFRPSFQDIISHEWFTEGV